MNQPPETGSHLASSQSYLRLVAGVRFALAVFFRRVESAGEENVPPQGGVLVSWHPNGVVDPALILTACPRPVVFGARSGLFEIPLFGRLVRALGTVPIYRAQDAGDGARSDDVRREANEKSLDALASSVAAGNYAALFPEGVSHDEPKLMELKTGAARLYYRAAQRAASLPKPEPALIPVGLHYDRKSVFRSSAFVRFYEPLKLPEELRPDHVWELDSETQREKHRELTKLINRVLTESVHCTESWELHRQRERARSLIRAERASRSGAELGRAEIAERARGFARVWAAYEVRVESHPEETRALMERLEAYARKLVALGLKDAELDHPPKLWISYGPVVLALQLVCLYLLIPPVLLFGFAVNTPPYLFLKGIVKVAARRKKDEASIKIVAGTVLFLATWLVVAALSALGQINLHRHFQGVPELPWLTFVVVLCLCILGAAGALHHKIVMAQTLRALSVRLTRRRQGRVIAELRAQRAALHDDLLALSRGVELPFSVSSGGTVDETSA